MVGTRVAGRVKVHGGCMLRALFKKFGSKSKAESFAAFEDKIESAFDAINEWHYKNLLDAEVDRLRYGLKKGEVNILADAKSVYHKKFKLAAHRPEEVTAEMLRNSEVLKLIGEAAAKIDAELTVDVQRKMPWIDFGGFLGKPIPYKTVIEISIDPNKPYQGSTIYTAPTRPPQPYRGPATPFAG